MSKKIQKTLHIEEDSLKVLEAEMKDDDRSLTYIVNQAIKSGIVSWGEHVSCGICGKLIHHSEIGKSTVEDIECGTCCVDHYLEKE